MSPRRRLSVGAIARMYGLSMYVVRMACQLGQVDAFRPYPGAKWRICPVSAATVFGGRRPPPMAPDPAPTEPEAPAEALPAAPDSSHETTSNNEHLTHSQERVTTRHDGQNREISQEISPTRPITVEELSRALGRMFSAASINRMARDGRIPGAFKRGPNWHFDCSVARCHFFKETKQDEEDSSHVDPRARPGQVHSADRKNRSAGRETPSTCLLYTSPSPRD